jgi:hypothetical protein
MGAFGNYGCEVNSRRLDMSGTGTVSMLAVTDG